MKTYNITTSLTIDNTESDGNISYPMIGRFDRQMKQFIYWKLAYDFFAVSVRINPEMKHILFTNDEGSPCLKNFDFKDELEQLGVEIKILPFTKYYIKDADWIKFKNTLYKFEVYDQLQHFKESSIFTDLDCLWTSKWDKLDELLEKYDLLVLDRSSHRNPDSRDQITTEMGQIFHEIDPNYPVKYPIWYGGGFIGGKPESFKVLSKEIKNTFDMLVSKAKDGQHYVLSYNDESMLDGDENIQTYVCNKLDLQLFDVHNYVKIVFSSLRFNNTSKKDYQYVIWHLASEKLRGLSLLFHDIKKKNSAFWLLKQDEIKYFLGKYVGIESKPIRLKLILLIDRIETIMIALKHPRYFFLHFKYYVLLFLGLR